MSLLNITKPIAPATAAGFLLGLLAIAWVDPTTKAGSLFLILVSIVAVNAVVGIILGIHSILKSR